MSRLGLSKRELDTVAADPHRLDGIDLRYVMSHLACAEQQSHELNALQLANFRAARARLPAAPASFSNSSGVFLGPDYHFDLARPGAALYGVAPVAGQPNPLRSVVRLQARVIQVREIEAGARVGYGGRWTAPGPCRIATVSTGYADGFLRSLGNRAKAYHGATALPVVGVVSMDTITLDVTGLPGQGLEPGDLVDLIGEHNPVDAVAEAAGTIGYEILTSLGGRYFRTLPRRLTKTLLYTGRYTREGSGSRQRRDRRYIGLVSGQGGPRGDRGGPATGRRAGNQLRQRG